MRHAGSLPVVLLACIVPMAAAAQSCPMGSGGAMPAMEEAMPVPPPDQLPVPMRMTGIGNSHIPIRAGSEAQRWFDQGLSLLHDFWDYEAARAFEEAIRRDPRCAMCYWGLAQAEGMRGGPAREYGRQALQEAVRLKGRAGRTDRLYIEAAFAEQSHQSSIPIYRRLVARDPHDIEARIFLANAVGDGFDDRGEPRPGQREKISILEGVLRDAPGDSAANHYWIHAMEPGAHPERAIPSAALLASLASSSGHMVHMPGHIYYRVGDYQSADRWFSASTEADERYMREQHVSVDDDWNYVHNLMYAIANLMEQGRLEAAGALSDRLAGARGRLSATLYVWSARDQITRVSRRLPVALRTGDWPAALALLDQARLDPGERTANLRLLQSELGSFALGMQALDRGDLAAARAASDAMDAGLWREGADAPTGERTEAGKKTATSPGAKPSAAAAAIKDPVNPDADRGPLVETLGVASIELRAGVELLKGDAAQARRLYDQAIAAEKGLGYHEPPFYIRPVAETEGQALLRARDYAGARAAFERALDERPNSGFELYGIARADELAGKAALARTEYEALLRAWPSADRELPEILRARAALAQGGGQGGVSGGGQATR